MTRSQALRIPPPIHSALAGTGALVLTGAVVLGGGVALGGGGVLTGAQNPGDKRSGTQDAGDGVVWRTDPDVATLEAFDSRRPLLVVFR